ncbi:MAG: hypothetical protein R2706_19975 [Acidimicrobiales bacterium]
MLLDPLAPGELRVYLDPSQADLSAIGSSQLDRDGVCRSRSPVVVCTQSWSALSADQLGAFVPLSGD